MKEFRERLAKFGLELHPDKTRLIEFGRFAARDRKKRKPETFTYHAVPGNTTQLRIFKLRVCRLWQSVLVRRSQRAEMRWERLTPVLNRWIPPPRVLHPYPDARFYATHPS
jgi:hypothetical protein